MKISSIKKYLLLLGIALIIVFATFCFIKPEKAYAGNFSQVFVKVADDFDYDLTFDSYDNRVTNSEKINGIYTIDVDIEKILSEFHFWYIATLTPKSFDVKEDNGSYMIGIYCQVNFLFLQDYLCFYNICTVNVPEYAEYSVNLVTKDSKKLDSFIAFTEENPTHDVSFYDSFTHLWVASIEETNNTHYIMPSNVPDRKGYKLAGWTDRNGGKIYTERDLVAWNHPRVLFSYWVGEDYLTSFVIALPNGKRHIWDVIEHYGSKFVFPNIDYGSFDGFVFEGWYYEQDFINKVDIDSICPSSDIKTLYAKFIEGEPQRTYRATFNSAQCAWQSGEYKMVIEQKKDNTLHTPEELPIYTDHWFAGWFLNTIDPNDKVRRSKFVTKDTVVTQENTIEYALWVADDSVLFYANGGSWDMIDLKTCTNKELEEAMKEENAPSYQGHTFDGWELAPNGYFTSSQNNDSDKLIYIAKWK